MSLQQQIEILRRQLEDMQRFLMFDLPLVLHQPRRKKQTPRA